MMWFTCPSLCGPLSFIKKDNKTRMRKITSDKRNYAARLHVRCSAVFHSEAVWSVVWCSSSLKCKKFAAEAKKSNAVHFLIVLWFIYTRCEVHFTFSSLKKVRLNKRNHAVLLPVWCSAVLRLLQCGFQSDEVPTSIWVSRKTECPHFGKFEIPLKP